MLGDSLTQHFYFSSLPSSFWRARTEWRKNWFLDTGRLPQRKLGHSFVFLTADAPELVTGASYDMRASAKYTYGKGILVVGHLSRFKRLVGRLGR